MSDANRDQNYVPVALGQSSTNAAVTLPFLISSTTGRLLTDSASGSGDVVGPASSTDNAVALWDGATGKLLKDSIIKLVTTVFSPTVNDGVSLGSGALSWSDLFMATGAAINIGNGNWVATHTSTILTVGTGDLRVTTAGTNAASVVTVGGTQTLSNKTFVAPVLGVATGTSLSVSGLLASATGLTLEETGAGTDIITIQAPASIAASYTLTLPVDDGNSGEVLSTDGNGVLAWVSAGGVPTTITVANEATDTSCFIAFFTAATGDLGPKTNVNMTFNSNTGVITLASSVLTTTDINGGTLDGVIIGGASAAAATVTTLSAGAITSTGLLTITVAGNTARFINSSDATPVQVARFEGDRATMADNDEAYISLMLSDDGGTQAEFARLRWIATDVNVGTNLDGSFRIAIMVAGTLTNTYAFNPTNFAPSANDQASLGTASTSFSDLFLASGAVINIANGDWVATHTAGILTVGTGDLRVTTAGTNSASVVTVGGTQTLTNKTLTSPTLTTPSAFTTGGTITLAENTSIALDPAGSADGKYTGITIAGTAGATLAFGDLVYLAVADSRWELTDADAATTADRMLGMCVLAAAADGDPTVLLLIGQIRADAKFPALTVGAAVYVGESAGTIQVAIPTGADNVIRRVGYALTADEIYFNPSMDSQTTVA